MSRVYSDTVLPEDSGVSQDITLGITGDTVQVTSGASLNVNTIKDSGGNTILVSDGSGNLSNLNADLAGQAPTLITTNTVTNGASSVFTANIDNTYKLYHFTWIDVNAATDDVIWAFNGSTDGGSNYNVTKTSTFYNTYNDEAGTSQGLSYNTGKDSAQVTTDQALAYSLGLDADESTSGDLFLFNPSNTSLVKMFYARSSVMSYHNYMRDCLIGGYFNTTSAINAIIWKCSSGNFDGIIKMYGWG